MPLVTGQITEIFEEDGIRIARLSVGGAIARIRLDLLQTAVVGDMVLSEAGVGIALVNPEQEKEGGHVPGNSR